MEILKFINRTLALPLVLVIWVYQRTLSPDHGFVSALYPHGFCKFYPSCSQYAKISLSDEGLTALPKIIWRIIKCNPWHTIST